MQVGKRWRVGEAPPKLPKGFAEAIVMHEAGLIGEARNQSWTLTWLESWPVLQLDDGTVLSTGGTPLTQEDDFWAD